MSKHRNIGVFCFLCLLLFVPQAAMAVEFTGRLSAVGAYIGIDDSELLTQGTSNHNNINQQSLRLMLEENSENAYASAHIKLYRFESHGWSQSGPGSSDFFRGTRLSNKDDIYTQQGNNFYIHEVDVLRYEHNLEKTRISLGRQAIDWGTGRFWQPMNVFGAFAPTDLDTDYKPGIDAVLVDYFPSSRASLSFASVYSSSDYSSESTSYAAFYRQQFGLRHELSVIVAEVLANKSFGAALESDWQGIGWRVEAVHYNLESIEESGWFWIAGADYYFANDVFLSVEFYRNALGADSEQALVVQANNPLWLSGVQQQLSDQVLGLALSRDFTPLMNLSYAVFGSELDDINQQAQSSVLQQFALRYSLSNNSDLQLSILSATGKGLDSFGFPQSEFGALDKSISLRVRHYF